MSQGNDHDGMDPGSMSDGGMHMSFYWGKDAIILFSGWPNGSLGMYILAFFCVFLLAAAIEIFSVSPTAKTGTDNPRVGALIQTCVYAVRVGFGYMVMLAVMSFNLGIFIAAVAGHTVGFFLVKVRALAIASQNENAPKV
ncbi:copper transporter 6-like [Populus alba x Populus x berolinensis]|nr:copper transporter 6-like [Populus alba x Populus x berolinensis]